jgi:hypothetical protein
VVEPVSQRAEEGPEQRVAVDRTAGFELHRGGLRGELGREGVGREVAPGPDDHRAGGAGVEVGLAQEPGQLPVRDHEIVRPLQPGRDPGNGSDGVGEREARGKREHEQSIHGEVGPEEHRHQQRRAGRRLPRPAEAAPSRGLVVGDGHESIRRTGARLVEQVAVRGVDAREMPHIPTGQGVGGRIGHRP